MIRGPHGLIWDIVVGVALLGAIATVACMILCR